MPPGLCRRVKQRSRALFATVHVLSVCPGSGASQGGEPAASPVCPVVAQSGAPRDGSATRAMRIGAVASGP